VANQNYDRLERSLERQGFVRAKAWAIANGFHPARIKNICVARLRVGRDWRRGRPKGGGGGEIWVHKSAIDSCGILNKEDGPLTDDRGIRWWALDDVPTEFGISVATIVSIDFKRRGHVALSGPLQKRLIRRGLRSGGAELMHFREDQLKRLKQHFVESRLQSEYHDEDGEKWLTTRALASATRLTKSCIKEKTGQLFRSKSLLRNGKRITFHNLRDAREAETRLACPVGFLTQYDVIRADRYPHITHDKQFSDWLRRGHPAITEGLKTPLATVNGHKRHVFEIEQLDRIEQYEKRRHESILDKDDREWSVISEGTYLDPDNQTWLDYVHAWKQLRISRKILDPLYNKSREELGRAICTELLEVPIERRNGDRAIHHVRVFWSEDVKRLKEQQEYQRRLLKLGVCRDSEGNVYATGARLRLAPQVALQRRRKGRLAGFILTLFGKPVWFHRVESEEVRSRFGPLSLLPIHQDLTSIPAPVPRRTLKQETKTDPTSPRAAAPATPMALSFKRRRGRTVNPKNAEIQKFCFDEISKGSRLRDVANRVNQNFGVPLTEPNIYEYAKRHANREGLTLVSARRQRTLQKQA
jgi:hypothetical protein